MPTLTLPDLPPVAQAWTEIVKQIETLEYALKKLFDKYTKIETVWGEPFARLPSAERARLVTSLKNGLDLHTRLYTILSQKAGRGKVEYYRLLDGQRGRGVDVRMWEDYIMSLERLHDNLETGFLTVEDLPSVEPPAVAPGAIGLGVGALALLVLLFVIVRK